MNRAALSSSRRSGLSLLARLLRRQLRRANQLLRWRRLSFYGVPVLFANSFPKSGTHLLTQVLAGFTRLGPVVDSGLPAVVMFEGDTGRSRPLKAILADLRQLRPGDIAYGHVHALPETQACLGGAGMAAYFILRDPRDVVVSHVHYVTEMAPEHIHHQYYTEVLHNFDERLVTSITGRPDWDAPFPDIRARFEPFMGWLDLPDVLTLKYEDFLADRATALVAVIDHAVARGFPLASRRAEALACLENSIDPQRSPTFRSGKAGGWRARFSPQHKRLFKQVTGDLLLRLGYEPDYNW